MSSAGTRLPRRVIAAATIGNALDVYDFAIYGTFSIQIGHAFFASRDPYINLMQALFVFGVGIIARPIGGYFLGRYADRVGRRAAMVFALGASGVSVVAMALIPTYQQIGVWAMVAAVAIRIFQGFALGAEAGVASAYLMEASAPEHRGLSVSWQGASQGIAGAIGALVGVLIARELAPAAFDAYGWRIAFLIGGLALPYGIYLRRAMPETLGLPELAPPPVATRLLSVAGRIVLIGAIVFAMRIVITYVLSYMTTYAEGTLGLPADVSIAASAVSSIGAAVGVLIGGLASDRIGRRPVMIWPNLLLLLATYPAFLWIVQMKSVTALWTGVAVLSVLAAIPGGAFVAAFTETLPKRIRATGYGLVNALTSAIFAATTQPAVTALIHKTGNKLAPAWYLLAAIAISQFAMMAIKESAPIKNPPSP